MKRILAISDIHGELDLFNKLLEKVEYDASTDQLILLGDYVDRGPDSKGVLERVVELKQQGVLRVLDERHDALALRLGDIVAFIIALRLVFQPAPADRVYLETVNRLFLASTQTQIDARELCLRPVLKRCKRAVAISK